ncbi:hypothetical protein AB0H69_24095 [Streptomyces phaeochromogenes]|uniref:hypothetical protein n=1 Tax=Streptomyces phaeochromogenes TaxID=1923 RepID=UPI0033E4ED3A
MNSAWLNPEEQLAVLDARDQVLALSRDRVAAPTAARVEQWSRRASATGSS